MDTNIGFDAVAVVLEELSPELNVVEGDLGIVMYRKDVYFLEVFNLDVEVVADHVGGLEAV
jgi:hypothetical protein